MTNEKLVAKVQYFYDTMLIRLREWEDDYISSTDAMDKVSCKGKTMELKSLISEYDKTFDSFLHKEAS